MKLSHIQEATYASPNYALWVKDILSQDKKEGHLLDVNVDTALEQLTAAFDPPKFIQEDGKYSVWVVRPKGARVPIEVYLYRDGGLFVDPAYGSMPLKEARYHGLHPAVRKIQEIIRLDDPVTRKDHFIEISREDVEVVVKDISSIFGELKKDNSFGDGAHVYYWDDLTRYYHRYEIDIGYDDTFDKPYGLNFTSRKVPGHHLPDHA